MAVYPAGNPGVFPLDPDTATGQFRLAYGDTQSTPYDPVESGIQNYTELSDAEIESFLTLSANSVPLAISYYYGRLASDAAKASKSIKDYDLAVDTTKRASQLLDLAAWWKGVADELAGEDAFEIVPLGRRHEVIPELAIPEYGRIYTWGRTGRWR